MIETKLNNISNYIRWNKFESSEQLYKHQNNLETPPLCYYCDEYAEYESFNKGYKKYCNYYKHADIIRKEALTKRKITIDTISHNILDYDDFIFKNINFYLSNDYPKNDIFDNKYLRSITKVRNKSNTNLKFFDVDIKCVCCGTIIKYNIFNNNKLYCNNKSCSNTIRYNEEFIDIALLYNFNIHQYSTFKKINTLNLDLSEINKLFNKYGFDATKMIISGYCIEYNNFLLYRQYLKYDFSFLKNNIKDDRMIRICKCCGKEYIYKDLYIKDDKNYYEKIIGAEHSCKNKKCYYNILTLCLYDRDTSEQSRKLKEKIFNGTFTPNITNSWANSKTFLKIYNKNFRSTWEAYFYLHMIVINNTNLEYEKLRIKYYDSVENKERNYITDFIDESNKILYEIKPYCYLSNQNVIDKEKYAERWCIENGYRYIFITEHWFKDNYDLNIVLNSEIDEIYKQKIKKALNFKKDNNEKNK